MGSDSTDGQAARICTGDGVDEDGDTATVPRSGDVRNHVLQINQREDFSPSVHAGDVGDGAATHVGNVGHSGASVPNDVGHGEPIEPRG
ncbi:hypothetical protein ACFFX0_10080 [Citricoccus parietis]|uniref:Uncharacterized protein n=1 Tax=Citricoccus parietis TaxID=592307 RepID=A0ABV5FZ66_9MICC